MPYRLLYTKLYIAIYVLKCVLDGHKNVYQHLYDSFCFVYIDILHPISVNGYWLWLPWMVKVAKYYTIIY